MQQLQRSMGELYDQAISIKPDFVPRSTTQLCYLLSEYELGCQWYASLHKPDALEERFAGLCHLALGNRELAYEHALKALEMGCQEAQIDLVRLYNVMGKTEKLQQAMATLDVSGFDRYNQAMWHRILSSIHSLNNEMDEAINQIEKAWQIIQCAPEFPFYAPDILLMYGLLYGVTNDKERNAYYLSRAEEICKTQYRFHIKLLKIMSFLDYARLDGIWDTAMEVREHSPSIQHKIDSNISLGRILLCYGKVKEARPFFEEASNLAIKHVMKNYTFNTYGYLAMIYHKLNLHHKMKAMLKKMQKHTGHELYDGLLKCYISYMDDSLSPEESLKASDEALSTFEGTGHALELLRVYMYRCEVMRRYFPEKFESAVEKLVNFMIENDMCSSSYEDWIFIEEVFDFINLKYPGIIPVVTSNEIRITTINAERIQYNGRDLKLPLSKTLELIVFLLLNKKASLQSILSQVFPDLEPTRAKNYFHQIKHQMAEKVGLLVIAYDAKSRMYGIESTYQIALDVQEHLEQKCKIEGVFLPSSGTDWVVEMNSRLMQDHPAEA